MILVFSLFSISCTHVRLKEKKKALLYLRTGSAFLINQNYPSSLEALLEAKKLDPTNPKIHNTLGLIYFVIGRYVLAEKSFRQSLDLDIEYTEARKNLGKLLLVSGYPEESIKELNKASEDLIYPYPERILLNLGMAYFHQGLYKKAEKKFELALKKIPKNCQTRIYYARTLYQQDLYQLALKSLNETTLICKENKSETLYYTALCHLGLNQVEKTKFYLERLVNQPQKKEKLYSKKARNILNILY